MGEGLSDASTCPGVTLDRGHHKGSAATAGDAPDRRVEPFCVFDDLIHHHSMQQGGRSFSAMNAAETRAHAQHHVSVRCG